VVAATPAGSRTATAARSCGRVRFRAATRRTPRTANASTRPARPAQRCAPVVSPRKFVQPPGSASRQSACGTLTSIRAHR
jgi:hypothetical protein